MKQDPKILLDRLITHLVIEHPLPWHVENDWTQEVTAADGTVIVKCPTQFEAEEFVEIARRLRQELEDAPLANYA